MNDNKMLITQGVLYTMVAMLTPTLNVLAGDTELTSRAVVVIVITSLISGALALKAFLSTTFADSPANTDAAPKAVTIDQPEGKPVITQEVVNVEV